MDAVTPIPERTLQLVGQIIEIARSDGARPGDRLFEHRLAQRLGVSRGPVRAALQVLAEAGLAGTVPNRGYVLTQALDSDVAKATLDTANSAERQYMAIAGDRLDGTLPELVSEAELTRRYGLKRAELMRLLDRIASEGWVERSAGYGWRFTQTLASPDAYAQTGRLRMMIEPGGILEPTFQVQEDGFARLRDHQMRLLKDGLKVFTLAEIFRFGCEFHEVIAECSGNAFLLETLKRINRIRRLFAYRLIPDLGLIERHTREHLRILDLLEASELPAAADLMRQHLWWSAGGSQITSEHVLA
jgi:DNA-binding GntR family transcriptional regulator